MAAFFLGECGAVLRVGVKREGQGRCLQGSRGRRSGGSGEVGSGQARRGGSRSGQASRGQLRSGRARSGRQAGREEAGNCVFPGDRRKVCRFCAQKSILAGTGLGRGVGQRRDGGGARGRCAGLRCRVGGSARRRGASWAIRTWAASVSGIADFISGVLCAGQGKNARGLWRSVFRRRLPASVSVWSVSVPGLPSSASLALALPFRSILFLSSPGLPPGSLGQRDTGGWRDTRGTRRTAPRTRRSRAARVRSRRPAHGARRRARSAQLAATARRQTETSARSAHP